MNEKERDFFVSKNTLDTINSLSWFLMDAAWMLQSKNVAVAMVVPTFLSGIFLCYIDKRKNVTYINFAVLSWIVMNASWMFSESFYEQEFLLAAKLSFVLGVGFVCMAVATTKDLVETFSHFKRFRIKSYFK